jgi:hypothetical protein
LKVFRLPAPSAGTAQTPKYSEPLVPLQSESCGESNAIVLFLPNSFTTS